MPEISGLLPGTHTIDTHKMPLAERLDAWNVGFGSLNAVTPTSDTGAHLSSRSENWMLGGGVVLSRTRVTPSHFVQDSAQARLGFSDHFIFRVLRHGLGRLQYKSFEATTKPGDLVLLSMHETWSIEWGDAEWVSVCVPRDLDLRLAAGLAALPPGIIRGARAGLIADMILALPARVATARPEEIPTLAAAIHAAIGACLLSGVSVPDSGRATDAAPRPARERVRQAILRNVRSTRLTPGHLASAAGVSRSALYRLYEAEGGVARYIQYVRLSLAHAALRDPLQADRSISVIAEAHGFPAHSDFSRAFKKAFGMAPSEVRATMQTVRAPLDRLEEQRDHTN